MTLRVEVSIIPFGNEEEKKIIETLNISNVSFREGRSESGEDRYVIERNNYKNYDEHTLRVFHNRKDGALELVKKALTRLQTPKEKI